MLVLLTLNQLDRAFDQVGVEVLDLLRLQLEVLKPGSDLVVRQKPLLKTIRDEPLQFLGVESTLSRPELSAEKPCALSGSDLPVGEAEPGVRVHHRHATATLSECSSCAVAPARAATSGAIDTWTETRLPFCTVALSRTARRAHRPTGVSPGRKPLRCTEIRLALLGQPKSFASSNQSIVPFTASPLVSEKSRLGDSLPRSLPTHRAGRERARHADPVPARGAAELRGTSLGLRTDAPPPSPNG
jgi:hypothetical protein